MWRQLGTTFANACSVAKEGEMPTWHSSEGQRCWFNLVTKRVGRPCWLTLKKRRQARNLRTTRRCSCGTAKRGTHGWLKNWRFLRQSKTSISRCQTCKLPSFCFQTLGQILITGGQRNLAIGKGVRQQRRIAASNGGPQQEAKENNAFCFASYFKPRRSISNTCVFSATNKSWQVPVALEALGSKSAFTPGSTQFSWNLGIHIAA